MLLFSKDFWNFNNQLGVIFSRWYSRLTRVLFNCNARVRPSIIGYRIWCCGAQETSWMTIRIVVLVIYIPLFELLCIHCMLLMWAVIDVLWWCNICKQIYLILSKDYLFSIIFYSAAMVRFWCWFCFLFFYLFFLNPNGSYFCTTWVDCCRIVLIQGVRICGSLQLVSELRLVITLALVGITHLK